MTTPATFGSEREAVRAAFISCNMLPDLHPKLFGLIVDNLSLVSPPPATAQGWVSVEKQMPEPHTPVLVIERGGERVLHAAWFKWHEKGMNKDHICWQQDHDECEADSGMYGNGATISARDLDVIAWMPMPALPTVTPPPEHKP